MKYYRESDKYYNLLCERQVNAAAKAVHAPVMDPSGKVMDPEGDAQLRGSYSANMLRLMERAGSRPVRDIIDLGCATGATMPLSLSLYQ